MPKPLTWPVQFCQAACREGWCVFDNSEYGREIEFDQAPEGERIWENDDEAIAYVIGRARFARRPTRDHYLRALYIHADECRCRTHDGHCPGDDCDGCPDCSTGRVRRALAAIERIERRG